MHAYQHRLILQYGTVVCIIRKELCYRDERDIHMYVDKENIWVTNAVKEVSPPRRGELCTCVAFLPCVANK